MLTGPPALFLRGSRPTAPHRPVSHKIKAAMLGKVVDPVTFEILKNDAGEYWWRIVGANGEILGHSQNYTAKVSAIDAINVVKSDASNAWVDDKTGEGASTPA